MINNFRRHLANLLENCKSRILGNNWFLAMDDVQCTYWKSLRTLKFRNADCLQRFLNELSSSFPNFDVTLSYPQQKSYNMQPSTEQMVENYMHLIPGDRNNLTISAHNKDDTVAMPYQIMFNLSTDNGGKRETRTMIIEPDREKLIEFYKESMKLCDKYCRPVSRFHPWADAVVVDTDSERETVNKQYTNRSADIKALVAIVISIITLLIQFFPHLR